MAFVHDRSRNGVVIFKNAHKQSDASPDYNAFITINGEAYRASLWTKYGSKGSYLSGNIITEAEFVTAEQMKQKKKAEIAARGVDEPKSTKSRIRTRKPEQG